MKFFASFIQRLRDSRRIRDLEKLVDLELQSQPNHPKIKQQKIDESTTDFLSLERQKQSHAHLAAKAALLYWQSDQNPIKITMSHGKNDKNKSNATATASSLKTLMPSN
jgi:hypothetical protein